MPSRKELALTHEALIWHVAYDEQTGKFTRVWSPQRRHIGLETGFVNKDGYWLIAIGPERYFAHRLAWFYVHKRWPEDQIDHEDRDKANNRLANLRESSPGQNSANKPAFKNSKTGIKGVCFIKKTGSYEAKIKDGAKYRYIGRFKTAAEASAAYYREALKVFGAFAAAA